MKKDLLITVRPEIAIQFHPSKNVDFSISALSSDYRYKVWWLCSKGHEWEESPYSRCKQKDANCRVCKTSIATTHPKLLCLWHPTKNLDCTPYEISAKGHKKIWWKCPKGNDHEWQAPPYNIARLKNSNGCPICRGFKVVKENSLATTHPNIAAEWDYEKNQDLTPYDVTAGSGRKVHWKCNVSSDHIWVSSIGGRTSKVSKGVTGKRTHLDEDKLSRHWIFLTSLEPFVWQKFMNFLTAVPHKPAHYIF